MAVLANILKNGKFVSKKEWEKYIEALKSESNAIIEDKRVIKKQIKQKIIDAIKKRIPDKKFGVLFSGGVDSSLIAFIAKKFSTNFMCYSVGLENSKDIVEAKKVAKELKFKLRYKVFSLKEAEEIIKTTVKVVGVADVIIVGVAAVEIAAVKLARKDNAKAFFGGLGAEELFAGYHRHKKASNVNEECWKGLKNMYSRDLVRDYKVAVAMKANFLVPFLDRELIISAMQIPGKYKINSHDKKIILREAAVELGLPKKTAFRKKIAAQYGSGFDKAIEKLARKNGFKHKGDYLTSLL